MLLIVDVFVRFWFLITSFYGAVSIMFHLTQNIFMDCTKANGLWQMADGVYCIAVSVVVYGA
jgi:hypothetical protein